MSPIALLNQQLMQLEPLSPPSDEPFSPIFIVGLPRSGTTLLYQFLVSFIECAYPTNLMARFWGNPIAGAIVQRELFGETASFVSSFSSHHGYSDKNLLEPHEFGYFWGRWFDHSRSHHTTPDTPVDPMLCNMLAQLHSLSKTPLVFKNLTLGLKIPLLKKLMPQARFVYVKRPPIEVASSLYRGRLERFGNANTWWSLTPKEIDSIGKLEPVEQVAAQAHYCKKQIEEDLQTLGSGAIIQIDYHYFCENTDKVLTDICNKWSLQPKNSTRLPNGFRISAGEKRIRDLFRPFEKNWLQE